MARHALGPLQAHQWLLCNGGQIRRVPVASEQSTGVRRLHAELLAGGPVQAVLDFVYDANRQQRQVAHQDGTLVWPLKNVQRCPAA